MNTHAAAVNELALHLDLRDAVHIGHSTGVGEVTRYVARYDKGRVAKAVLVPGLPHGMPTTHADQINADLLAFITS
jgi:non-heme chloroperoxidase